MDARGGGAAAAAALFDADAGSGFSVRGVRARCEEEEEEEEDLDVDDPPRLRPTVNAVGFTILDLECSATVATELRARDLKKITD